MTRENHKQRSEPYDPTPDEIAAECRKIRAGWSEETYRVRAGGVTRMAVRESVAWTPEEYTEKEISEMLGGTSYR